MTRQAKVEVTEAEIDRAMDAMQDQVFVMGRFSKVDHRDWREIGKERPDELADIRTMVGAMLSTARLTHDTPKADYGGEVREGWAQGEHTPDAAIDFLERRADEWMADTGVQRMFNAIASVFEKHAPQEIMDRFREKLGVIGRQCHVEGALRVWEEISHECRLRGQPLPPPGTTSEVARCLHPSPDREAPDGAAAEGEDRVQLVAHRIKRLGDAALPLDVQLELGEIYADVLALSPPAPPAAAEERLREALASVWRQAESNHRTYSATGDTESDIRVLTLGITGEAGELANFVKKRWRDGDGHEQAIRYEIADVCAYAFMLASTFGMTPDDLIGTIAEKQRVFVEKMSARAALQPERG